MVEPEKLLVGREEVEKLWKEGSPSDAKDDFYRGFAFGIRHALIILGLPDEEVKS